MARRAALVLLAFVFLAEAPATAADRWIRIATPNFEVYTSGSEKQGRDALRHFEQVREFFLQAAPVRISGDYRLRVIQFDTESQFQPYRPNGFTLAYFVATPAQEYIVMGDQAADIYAPAIHEYMHFMVRHSGLKLPTWLDEGWADVFSTLRPDGKNTAVGDLLPERMKSLTADQWLDFDALTSVDSSSPIYHEASRVGIFYAESWALAHMLYLSPEYKDNFGRFVMALNGGKSAAEACEIAFGRSSKAVFQDLHSYLERKKIYGRIFETRIENRDAGMTSAPVDDFDAGLVLANLLVAIGRNKEARAEYARLEHEQPDRPDLLQAVGNQALWNKDNETARRYFAKAFEAGDSDPRMCYQFAMLELEAKQPPAKIVPLLERALQSKPDYTDARVQLGLTQIEARDFPGGIATLVSIPTIASQWASPVYCALAYAYIQNGDLQAATQSAATCRRWSRTEVDMRRADRIGKFVEARAKPSAAVRPGEKLRQVVGLVRNVQCSPEGNRLQITLGDKVASFDLPEPDAVELPATPKAVFAFTCGAQKPIRMAVEFAPPRSAMETSSGVVRRLDY